LIQQPGPREVPVSLQCRERDAERVGGLALAEAGEIPELDDAAGARIEERTYIASGKPGASMRVMQPGFLMCCAAIQSSA
jgi:hypothetical protein